MFSSRRYSFFVCVGNGAYIILGIVDNIWCEDAVVAIDDVTKLPLSTLLDGMNPVSIS